MACSTANLQGVNYALLEIPIVDILSCSMAMSDYLLRFRQLTTQELQDKRTALEARDNEFSAQSMGTKSFQRDLRMLQDQLNAIAFVLRERNGLVIIKPPINYGVGVTDFSDVS